MATTTLTHRSKTSAESFWPISALIMALVQVGGFSTSLAMGRSSFQAPIYLHIHAFLFFGWVWLFLLQSFLADRAGMAVHRRLGWLAVAWIPAMVFMGVFVTVAMVRRGGMRNPGRGNRNLHMGQVRGSTSVFRKCYRP